MNYPLEVARKTALTLLVALVGCDRHYASASDVDASLATNDARTPRALVASIATRAPAMFDSELTNADGLDAAAPPQNEIAPSCNLSDAPKVA